MQLSVLDQSPVREDGDASQALAETLELARHAESLGYARFWVSEHHSFNALAGSAPEVILGALGQTTSTIRIGSGGIMLPHYSAFKIAEVASLLACLFPGRVDLGLGRAPGTDMISARALAIDGQPRFEQFPQQIHALQEMLHNKNFQPPVRPQPSKPAALWMLGSSGESAALAAQRGIPYNFALFINGDIDRHILDDYRRHFVPSIHCEKPATCLSVNVVCADSEEQAFYLARSREVTMLQFFQGKPSKGIMSPERAASIELSPQEEAFIAARQQFAAIGTPEQVREKLLLLAQAFNADELMAVTITYNFAERKRSYQLLAETFDLRASNHKQNF